MVKVHKARNHLRKTMFYIVFRRRFSYVVSLREFEEHYTPFRGGAKARVLSKKLFTVLTPTKVMRNWFLELGF